MPIYEYRCESCGEVFERFLKMSDDPTCECPKCGETARRLISQTSFSLKGAGWYKDGYSSKKGEGSKPSSTPCAGKSCEECKKDTKKTSKD